MGASGRGRRRLRHAADAPHGKSGRGRGYRGRGYGGGLAAGPHCAGDKGKKPEPKGTLRQNRKARERPGPIRREKAEAMLKPIRREKARAMLPPIRKAMPRERYRTMPSGLRSRTMCPRTSGRIPVTIISASALTVRYMPSGTIPTATMPMKSIPRSIISPVGMRTEAFSGRRSWRDCSRRTNIYMSMPWP
jgi:hypothetical protein